MQNIGSNQTIIHYTGRKQLLKGQTKIKLDCFVLSSKPGKRILATPTILVSCCIYGEARGSRVSSAYMAVPQGQVFLININTMKLYSITNENKHIIFHSFVLEAHILTLIKKTSRLQTMPIPSSNSQASAWACLRVTDIYKVYCFKFVV